MDEAMNKLVSFQSGPYTIRAIIITDDVIAEGTEFAKSMRPYVEELNVCVDGVNVTTDLSEATIERLETEALGD